MGRVHFPLTESRQTVTFPSTTSTYSSSTCTYLHVGLLHWPNLKSRHAGRVSSNCYWSLLKLHSRECRLVKLCSILNSWTSFTVCHWNILLSLHGCYSLLVGCNVHRLLIHWYWTLPISYSNSFVRNHSRHWILQNKIISWVSRSLLPLNDLYNLRLISMQSTVHGVRPMKWRHGRVGSTWQQQAAQGMMGRWK